MLKMMIMIGYDIVNSVVTLIVLTRLDQINVNYRQNRNLYITIIIIIEDYNGVPISCVGEHYYT